MRILKRIDVVEKPLKKNIRKFIDEIYVDQDKENSKYVDEVENLILKDWNKIIKYWKENPDLRFTQVLVNHNYVDNLPGVWYYTEEVEWLISNKLCKAENILHWGVNYDKDMNRYSETKWTLIKDLDTNHIEAILTKGYCTPTSNPLYYHTFTKVFNKRISVKSVKSKN